MNNHHDLIVAEPAVRPAPPAGTHRLLAAAGPELAAHIACHGPLAPAANPRALIDLIAAAGLRGRGGAGFPTARKMAAAGAERGPILIANGAEGEPESCKDAVLLARAPHLVLDGLTAAAAAVGARECHLYAAESALTPVRRALSERLAAGCREPRVQLTVAPDTFLSGEKSAVVNGIAGRAALPSDQRMSLSHKGLHGRPTLVHNVETLAHIALIARYGPHWFRALGTAEEPGTMLVTLGRTVVTGVVEVPIGTPLLDLIAGGGRTDPGTVRAVLIGGYHGTWIPGTALPQSALSTAGLRPLHATPGAGVVRLLPLTECGLRASADIASYLAEQSAGQCGPCRNGLPQLAADLTELAYGRGGGDPAEIARLAHLVDGRGSCHHPDGTARMVRSALIAFADDVRLHRRGVCQATLRAAGYRSPR
ncbi:NADH-quinone oxidoreductase subunit F [Nocardia sp. NBC_01503]|uniref:NADH-ubiquinone oxidoreductase-F iron-sulfur binding region domain-containing protein n=1 Tax=Nocardia sp. NBC_01503 TaxID=2975997 RepID=UPI002E7B59D7|nr:NADH-ubiquinone oxidoreductase-F iron-sulfur binding region domain-containing protein [Nocardia sp. NBC_01503]WTL33373.1 NADH-quinone oxidoreductase subunit F [Nocardia sp. NBC_01503]